MTKKEAAYVKTYTAMTARDFQRVAGAIQSAFQLHYNDSVPFATSTGTSQNKTYATATSGFSGSRTLLATSWENFATKRHEWVYDTLSALINDTETPWHAEGEGRR